MPTISDKDRARMRWMQLYLQLPEKGVSIHFPDEMACEMRFQETRWLDGISCPRCSGKRHKWRRTRKTYLCKNCSYEFSLKIGTFMFRSRHSIREWFLAAEEHIELNATGAIRVDSVQSFADRYGSAYTTAHRLRANLEVELELDASLLLSCICVSEIKTPQDVVDEEFNFFTWLLDACRLREQQRKRG